MRVPFVICLDLRFLVSDAVGRVTGQLAALRVSADRAVTTRTVLTTWELIHVSKDWRIPIPAPSSRFK